jgi:transposase-like protein
VVHAIRYLRDDRLLTKRQLQAATVVINWLADHLEAPDRVVLRTHPSAVSWFRESSGRHLVRMQRLVNIAESNGVNVRRRQTMTPGRIVYSDPNQILALPRKRQR